MGPVGLLREPGRFPFAQGGYWIGSLRRYSNMAFFSSNVTRLCIYFIFVIAATKSRFHASRAFISLTHKPLQYQGLTPFIVLAGRPAPSFDLFLNLSNFMNRYLINQTSWPLAVLYQLCRDLRELGEKVANPQPNQKKKKNSVLFVGRIT